MVYQYRGTTPQVPESAFLAPGSVLVGDVILGERVSIWFNCTIRGDVHFVRIGDETNIQDNAVLHVTHETNPLQIGRRVTAGHGATLHGCTIEDEVLIGMRAIVLDGAIVESHSMVAAGAVVPPGMRVEKGTLVGGVPARVLRMLRDDEIADLPGSAERYVEYARQMRAAL